jgi:RHH-type rel operon transcriptional repressor/antitoxin RelB
MPVKTVTVSEDEAALLEVVRERLANPQKGIKVRLDDL